MPWIGIDAQAQRQLPLLMARLHSRSCHHLACSRGSHASCIMPTSKMACDTTKKASAGQHKHRVVLILAFAPVGYAEADDDDHDEQCRQKNDPGTRKTFCCNFGELAAR